MSVKIHRNGGGTQRSMPLTALPKLDAMLNRLKGIDTRKLVFMKLDLSKVRTVQINLPTAGKSVALIAPEDKTAQSILIKYIGKYLVLSNIAEIAEHCAKQMNKLFCIADLLKIFDGIPDDLGLKEKAYEEAMLALIKKYPIPAENKPKPMFPDQEDALENSTIADIMITILKTGIGKMIQSIERK